MVAGGILLPSTFQSLLGLKSNHPKPIGYRSGAKEIRIALIGSGEMGIVDANTALLIDGVKIVAVCDLYDARLEQAKKQWGEHLFITRDYNEI
jgi:threonine dehydrogenase-like Zn-dependent dehydrogenase